MPLDSTEFRQALSSFATGVTVITARNAAGENAGITINSFSSVSLEPPLVLWSLTKSCSEYDIFIQAEHYCINVLSSQQQSLSEHFAIPQTDKFANIITEPGLHSIPKLTNCISYFECSHWQHYDGGDHTILIAKVEQFSCNNSQAPLIFYNSKYRSL